MKRRFFQFALALICFTSMQMAIAQTIELADNAPDSYTVVKGDTLWAISGRFLKKPWYWPKVWRMNKAQIRNPHLIYPGQIIYLDRSGPFLSLTPPGKKPGRNDGITYEPANSLSSVSLDAIREFLTKPLFVGNKLSSNLPSVIAVDDGAVIAGRGDTIFAKNIPTPSARSYAIYRPDVAVIDPVTKEHLGYEARYIGSARVLLGGEVATLQVLESREEISVKDVLVEEAVTMPMAIPPQDAPENAAGYIVSLDGSLRETSARNVVMLRYGIENGAAAGQVLALVRNRGTAIVHNDKGRPETYQLPTKRYGLAYVFRVFNKVSYALVVEADGVVALGDRVETP